MGGRHASPATTREGAQTPHSQKGATPAAAPSGVSLWRIIMAGKTIQFFLPRPSCYVIRLRGGLFFLLGELCMRLGAFGGAAVCCFGSASSFFATVGEEENSAL